MSRKILVDADLIEQMLLGQALYPLRQFHADALRAALATDIEVHAAMKNPCVHESGFEVISIHWSNDSAKKAVEQQRALDARIHKGVPEWVKHEVFSFKVKP